MHQFFLISGVFLILLLACLFIRAIKGPTVMDRLVAINAIGTKSIVLLVIMGILFKRLDMFVDIAIGYGLLNFIAAIAAAKYIQHHKTMHPETSWEKKHDTDA